LSEEATVAQEIRLKRNIASLVGGVAIALFIFVLWVLIAGSTTPLVVASGLVVASAVGVWVRLADL
jgi:hypothetical protein